jgi:ATP-dependent DNA helicase RecQ
MAEQRPTSLSELGKISGIGQRKLDAYGDAFLAAIRPFA